MYEYASRFRSGPQVECNPAWDSYQRLKNKVKRTDSEQRSFLVLAEMFNEYKLPAWQKAALRRQKELQKLEEGQAHV